MLARATAAEIFARYDDVARGDFFTKLGICVLHDMSGQDFFVGGVEIARGYDDVGVDIVAEFPDFCLFYDLA